MDNLTHTLVGLMISRCGFDSIAGKRGERGMAAMAMLAANTPDIDGFSFFYNQLEYLEVHRGYTHALLFIPAIALLPMLLVKAVTRQRPTLLAWFVCMLVVLSHLLLDWLLVYGLRMYLPFSDRWLRLDIGSLIDPIVWAILLLAASVPYVLSLASREIGSRKATGGRRGWAWAALLMLTGYEVYRWNSHQQAVESMNALLYMGQPARNVYAFPDGLWRWRGVVEGSDFFYEIPVGWDGEFSMNDARLEYKAAMTLELEAARRDPVFQTLVRFNQVPFWRASPLEDGTLVQLIDLRFGGFNGGLFTATAIVHADGRVENARLGR